MCVFLIWLIFLIYNIVQSGVNIIFKEQKEEYYINKLDLIYCLLYVIGSAVTMIWMITLKLDFLIFVK